MIKLDVIDDEEQHFTVSGDEPFRVEVTSMRFGVVAHVYRGAESNTEDEPAGAYDSSLDTNTSWRV